MSTRQRKKPIREVYDWEPVQLLCSRFGVPDPYEMSGVECPSCPPSCGVPFVVLSRVAQLEFWKVV